MHSLVVHPGALGLLDRLEDLLATTRHLRRCRRVGTPARPGSVAPPNAFWAAGADLNWEPNCAHGTPLDAAGGLDTRQQNVITWRKDQGARSIDADSA